MKENFSNFESSDVDLEKLKTEYGATSETIARIQKDPKTAREFNHDIEDYERINKEYEDSLRDIDNILKSAGDDPEVLKKAEAAIENIWKPAARAAFLKAVQFWQVVGERWGDGVVDAYENRQILTRAAKRMKNETLDEIEAEREDQRAWHDRKQELEKRYGLDKVE